MLNAKLLELNKIKDYSTENYEQAVLIEKNNSENAMTEHFYKICGYDSESKSLTLSGFDTDSKKIKLSMKDYAANADYFEFGYANEETFILTYNISHDTQTDFYIFGYDSNGKECLKNIIKAPKNKTLKNNNKYLFFYQPGIILDNIVSSYFDNNPNIKRDNVFNEYTNNISYSMSWFLISIFFGIIAFLIIYFWHLRICVKSRLEILLWLAGFILFPYIFVIAYFIEFNNNSLSQNIK